MECEEACKFQHQNMNIGCDIDETKENDFIDKFVSNCDEWNCINNDKVDNCVTPFGGLASYEAGDSLICNTVLYGTPCCSLETDWLLILCFMRA